MTLARRPLVLVAGLALLAGGVVSAVAQDEGDGAGGAERGGAERAAPASAGTAGFVAKRCQMLAHDRRRLELEARRLADEELEPIFLRMEDRVDEFADWAFRWRTSYALMRRSGLGVLSALAQGESVPERLRAERDGFVEEAFHKAIVQDEDRALTMAAVRWRDRLRAASDEMDREHDTAVALYLGFPPRLGAARPLRDLPPAVSAPGATGDAKTFAMTRVARPMLVRVTGRLGAAFVPASLVPEVLGETSLIPAAPVTVATLLSIDFLISRLDAWHSRDVFAAEMRVALEEARVRLRDTWVASGRSEIDNRVRQRRELLAAMAGPAGCAPAL